VGAGEARGGEERAALRRKGWTAKEADEWSWEDTITIVISPLIYVMLLVGGALSALLVPAGFVILAAGVVLLVVMARIINPKLSAISEAYEKKQKEYIEDLERKVKWED
jgi:hypothetical protein